MYPGLSLDQAPPILVPFRYFLTAPLFGVIAALLSLYTGSDMLDSRWLPSMLALTHLITLGVISMIMIGALFQMSPVVAGAAIVQESRVSALVHLLLSTGTLILCWGFYSATSNLLQIAVITLGAGFIVFIVMCGHALWRAPRNHDSVHGMRLAVVFGLTVTIILGLFLASGHAWQDIPIWRVELTRHHILWGSVAWITLLVAVIAYQVVPMFQMTAEYPTWIRRYWANALFTLLLSSALVQFIDHPFVILVDIILGIALLLFAITTLYLQRQRKRRLTDVTLNFWRLGMLSLSACAGLYCLNLLWPHSVLEPLIGALFFMGFALSVINGMLYKIVPFLVWLHLQNCLLATMQLGKIRIPNMKQVIPDDLCKGQFWLHSAALLFLLPAIFLRDPWFHLAWTLYLASFVLLGYNLWTAFRCFLRESTIITAHMDL